MIEGTYIWQDREVRFDVSLAQLQPRKGEVTIDSINAVEDTKGNNGEKGNMIITNLRLIWFNDTNQKINLSVGYDCIVGVELKYVESRLKGSAQALFVKTKQNQNRFEFIFTSLVSDSPRLFTSFQAVVRSYETTKLYRDLRTRSSIIQDHMLNLLPMEHVYNKYPGVWNLSADQQSPGTMVITNVRVVWYAQAADSFNVSLPWIQILRVKVRDSIHGKAIVLETHPCNNSYMAGFKIENFEKLYIELSNLLQAHSENPVFGIQSVFEEAPAHKPAPSLPRVTDDVQIVESEYKAPSAVILAYLLGLFLWLLVVSRDGACWQVFAFP